MPDPQQSVAPAPQPPQPQGAPAKPAPKAQTVRMFDPKGTVREVPWEDVMSAYGDGGKVAVPVRDPKGVTRYVPEDHVSQALTAGGVAVERPDLMWKQMRMALGGGTSEDVQNSIFPAHQPDAWERFAHSAGVPAHFDEVRPMLKGMLQPEASQEHPGFGQTIPLVGPAFRAQRETFDQPGWGKVYGSIPLVGPPGYRAGQQFQQGDVAGGVGSLFNIVTQFLGMKGAAERPRFSNVANLKPGEEFIPRSVAYQQGGAYKPGVSVTGTPTSGLGGYFARTFGLSSDYGQQVADRVGRINDIRENTRKNLLDTHEALTGAKRQVAAQQDAAIAAIEQHLEAQNKTILGDATNRSMLLEEQGIGRTKQAQQGLTDLQAQYQQTGRRVLADTTRAVYEDHARVAKPFAEIGEAIKKPISEGNDIRTILNEEAQKYNVRPEEIPPAAYKALGPEGKVQLAGAASGMRIDQIPENIRAVMTPEELGQKPLSFNDLTRIKDDVYAAADASKDGTVQVALRSAGDRISQIQEQAADTAGLGDKYRKAKQGWLEFKRGAGSPMMNDWLSAKDVEDQAVAPKLASIMDRPSAEALRTTLKYLGVDVTPLDNIISDMKATKEQLKAIPKETKAAQTDTVLYAKQRQAELKDLSKSEKSDIASTAASTQRELNQAATSHARDLNRAARIQIAKEQAKGKILPGKTSEDLEGLSTEQINRERLQALAHNARAAGISNPQALFMTLYGLGKIMTGNPRGMINLGYGAMRMTGQDLVNSSRMQEFVLRKAGIIPDAGNMAKIRRGLAEMSFAKPISKAARSQVLTQPQGQSDDANTFAKFAEAFR